MALVNAVDVADGGGGTTLKKSNSTSSNTANPNNAANNSSSNQTTSSSSNAVPVASSASVSTSPADTFNYNELKKNIIRIVDYLEKSSINLQRTINDLNNYYVVNGNKSELQNQLETLKKDINKTSNYLSDTVIAEINKKI